MRVKDARPVKKLETTAYVHLFSEIAFQPDQSAETDSIQKSGSLSTSDEYWAIRGLRTKKMHATTVIFRSNIFRKRKNKGSMVNDPKNTEAMRPAVSQFVKIF